MSNIYEFYREECEESERLHSQAGQVEYQTTMSYLTRYCKAGMRVLDACAGGGIYAFPLAAMGCKVIAGDLIDRNVAHIKELDQGKCLEEVYQGSVLDLSRYKENSFDVVLNLGSFYHLCDEEERKQSLRETLRVLKPKGIYMISYINRYANYMAHLDEFANSMPFLEYYMENGHIEYDDLFYATTPEGIEEEMADCPVELLHNVATDGPIFLYGESVNMMKLENFEKFMKLHFEVCENKSNLGISEHGLLIARKR